MEAFARAMGGLGSGHLPPGAAGGADADAWANTGMTLGGAPLDEHERD